jgi:hypothetical protein
VSDIWIVQEQKTPPAEGIVVNKNFGSDFSLRARCEPKLDWERFRPLQCRRSSADTDG